MASRLNRWGVAAILGFAGVLVATLPPGPSRLEMMFLRWEEPDRDPLGGALHSVQGVLVSAKLRLAAADHRTALRSAAALRRSPIVVRVDSGVMHLDEKLTRRAEMYWRRAGVPAGATRTILVAGATTGYEPVGTLDSALGACVVALPHPQSTGRRRDVIGSSAGRCLLQARFGPPGPLVRAWVDSAYQLYIPERAPRVPLVSPIDAGAQQWPQWFLDDGRGSWSGWFRSREALACSAGRSEFCAGAVGLPAGQPHDWRRSYVDRRFYAELPAALLEELGPERFGELWRGHEGIEEAFERLSGAPFEPWAQSYIQRRTGTIVRPTGLELGGWVAWIFWIGILTGWLSIRLRTSQTR